MSFRDVYDELFKRRLYMHFVMEPSEVRPQPDPAVRPQDYYWHTLMQLVLIPTLGRSSTCRALPHPDTDRLQLEGLREGWLEHYTDVLTRNLQGAGDGGTPIHIRESPMVHIRRLVHEADRLVVRFMEGVGYNPQERVNSHRARRSCRIEKQRGPWWADAIARWRAHIALMQQTADAIFNHGFPSAIEQLARNEGEAFWDTYWHLLLFLDDPADFTDRQRSLFHFSDHEMLQGLLCHELPHRLYPVQRDACIEALNRLLPRLRSENKEGYLHNDYARQALATMQIVLMPAPDALGHETRQAFRDI